MDEYFKEAVEVGSPEHETRNERHRREFKAALAEQGITDSLDQAVAMAFLSFSVARSAIRHGIIEYSDPIEAAREELIAHGITDHEQQKPILHRLYQDLEDPRSQRQ